MQRDQLKSQGTIYLPEEDLQDALKEDGTTQSIKTGGIAYNNKEEEEEEEEAEKKWLSLLLKYVLSCLTCLINAIRCKASN